MILIFLAFMGFLFYLHQTNAEIVPVEFIPLVVFGGLVSWWLHHIIAKLIEDKTEDKIN